MRLLSSQLAVLEWSQQEKNRIEKSPIQAALHHRIKEPTLGQQTVMPLV